MKQCFLFGEGKYTGGMSREHYISRAVLKFIAGNRDTIEVSGLHWQNSENQTIGINSLQSKILCQGHNSSLANLDAMALRFFETLNNVDKDPASVPDCVSHSGTEIERWFVKVLCGLTAAANWGDRKIYPNWKKLLLGKA